MKAIQFFLILLTTISLSFTDQVFSQGNDEDSLRTMEAQVLKLVNEHRNLLGLSEMKIDFDIHAEALKHSMNMANGTVPFSHDGFDGRADRLMSKIGGNAIAENVASGQTDAESAMESWLGSTGHKNNIEGNYNLTGIGIARGRNGDLFFTQIFLLNKTNKK